MPSRAELRQQRHAGPAPAEIEFNRRLLYDPAAEGAHAALVAAEEAVVAVEEAADLAEAQAAVDGLADTLGDAKTGIEGVRPDLIEA